MTGVFSRSPDLDGLHHRAAIPFLRFADQGVGRKFEIEDGRSAYAKTQRKKGFYL
jgi:hypothetical protein